MENKYYKKDGDFTSGYDYCFHTKPKDVVEEVDSAGATHYYIRLSHCYDCHMTTGLAEGTND